MNRRAFLRRGGALSLALGSLSGCIASPPTRSFGPAATEPTRDWPTLGFDDANTGYDPDGTGPGGGAEVAWNASLDTPTGYSSPVVSRNTVFAAGTGSPCELRAYDAASGERSWSYEVDEYATGAPTVADGTVYVGGWGQRFYAVDAADGSEVWTAETGHYSGRCAPTVVDDAVYVGTNGYGPLTASGDTPEDAFKPCAVIAFNAATGDERWRYDEFGRREQIDTTPAAVDGALYVGAGDTGLVSLDAATGEHRWTAEFEHGLGNSPVVADGVVYAVESGRSEQVRAFDADSGDERWTADVEGVSLRAAPAVADGVLYVTSTLRVACAGSCEGDLPDPKGYLTALDAETGEERWTHETKPGTDGSPAVVGDSVVFVAGGALEAVTTDGDPTFRVEIPTGERSLQSSPAVADGRAFVHAPDGTLFAVA